VFQDAHRLVIATYAITVHFPRDEWYGLRLQIRRAAVSIPANLVEGNARKTTRDYCSFINIALGSARELAYLLRLASELQMVPEDPSLVAHADSVVAQLCRLQEVMEERAHLKT
jgi:four helix bundle protein